MARNSEVTFEVVKEIAVLSEGNKGWSKQANLISWNGKPAKLDIRDWNEDRSKMGKGVTLGFEEAQLLLEALNDNIDDLDVE
jgi:hypothetical protein